MVCFTGILGVLSSRQGAMRFVTLIVYVSLLGVIVAVLLFIAVTSLTLASGKNSVGVQDFLRNAWRNTVLKNKTAVCNVQKDFDCVGFLDGECKGCTQGTPGKDGCTRKQSAFCPICQDAKTKTDARGCYQRLLAQVGKVVRPIGIVSCIATAFILLDVIAICAIQ